MEISTGFQSGKLRSRISYPNYGNRDTRNNLTQTIDFPLPKERFLVFQSCPCFWGASCISMNCSCRALCSSVLGTPVIDFDDVFREGIKLDVFCICNVLDHFVDPRVILKRALEVSRLVFVDVHTSEEHSTFPRQHLYAFGRNFLDAIREEKWSYVDVTEIVRKPNQYCYLVSREMDLQETQKLG